MCDWEAADAFEDAVVAEPINEIEAQQADNFRAALTKNFSKNSFQFECLIDK